MSAPVLCVPLAPSAPVQPPEAVHEVALVELHVSVDAAPLAIVVGAALSDAVGSGSCSTGYAATTSAARREQQRHTDRMRRTMDLG